jgi:hypothetical protein
VEFDFLTAKETSSDYINSDDPNAYRELIRMDFAFKDKVTIKIQDNKVIYSLFGKTVALDIHDANTPNGTVD